MRTPQWADAQAGLSNGDTLWGGQPRVVNMSFTFEYNSSLGCPSQTTCPSDMTSVDTAVQRLLDANIAVVTAAGNQNAPIHTAARSFTPARI